MAIGVIGRTLAPLDADQKIPAYGFGDKSTTDQAVFSLLDGGEELRGFTGVQARYRELIPAVHLAGPTTFAPLISEAIRVVCRTRTYHILLILADGQVTRGSDVAEGEFSRYEQDTIDAIVEASYFPLSIVMVGIGDGPWEAMEYFDDSLPARVFDNFQFCRLDTVELNAAASAAAAAAAAGVGYPAAAARLEACEAKFSVAALQEVPDQWSEIQHHGLMSFRRAPPAAVPVLNPPRIDPALAAARAAEAARPAFAAYGVTAPSATAERAPEPSAPPAPSSPAVVATVPGPGSWSCAACTLSNAPDATACGLCMTPRPAGAGAPVSEGKSDGGASGASAPPAPELRSSRSAEVEAYKKRLQEQEEAKLCPVCIERAKDTVFGCGHFTCGECAAELSECPMCRAPITARIKTFG